jgi:hypothetical protein
VSEGRHGQCGPALGKAAMRSRSNTEDREARRASRSIVRDVTAGPSSLLSSDLPCLAGSRPPESTRRGAPIDWSHRVAAAQISAEGTGTGTSARRRLDNLRSFGKEFVDTFREIPCSPRAFAELAIAAAIDIDVLAEQNGSCSATCPSGGGA